MNIAALLQQLSIISLPLLLAITMHEAAHGFVADKKGDPTAKLMGRLTLNPLAHIDLFGTIIIPLMLLFTTGFMFGYAKPVPVNPANLRDPKRDMAWVAAAGPLTNLALALCCGLLFRFIVLLDPSLLLYLRHVQGFVPSGDLSASIMIPVLLMLIVGVKFNVLLAIFNLLPIPPLDGGRVAVGVLPPKQAMALSRVEPYGIFIVLGLLFFDSQIGLMSTFLWPLIALLSRSLLGEAIL